MPPPRHMTYTCVTEEADKITEKLNITQSLKICGYKDWVFDTATPRNSNRRHSNSNGIRYRGSVVIPYVRGASEALRRILGKSGIAVHFKPQNTLRSLLVAPKDKTSPLKCSGTIYQLSCKDCSSTYVGESGRPLGARIKEHQRTSSVHSPVQEHSKAGHHIDWDNVKILDKESDWFRRGVKEAIHIRKTRSDLNKDQGRHRLSKAYSSLLCQRLKTRDLRSRSDDL